MLATDYPILKIFFTMVLFFLLLAWIWTIVFVLTDVFRSHDLSGLAKALWLLFVLFFPVVGVVVYLIARGHHITAHMEAADNRQDAAMRRYMESAGSPPPSAADELDKLAKLHEKGVLTDAEYEKKKSQVLN
jgi:hypothetical protein